MDCKSCNKPQLTSFFCSCCNVLDLSFKSEDKFETLGLKKEYQIDKEDFEDRYLTLSKVTHPDRYQNLTEDQKTKVLNLSAQINGSYFSLKNDLTRAQLVLDHLISGGLVLNKKLLPDGFLFEILEIREEMDEPSIDDDRLEEIESEVEVLRKNTHKEIEAIFQDLTKQNILDIKHVQAVQTKLNTISYYDRILEQIEGKLDE
ncbi:MAG: Fe-S protein assembly co-chaperone HscB [Candidatus Cloacimonadota bacterium]|nr:MAG: Fe-S protein assembly co-chaperone HscB [Candidatus Cloacimonadota bacterium]PCJ20132.1 MAG: Fe-S protein assembly co-chaperone HscB [Candidatus Cloacimonadota bacterium]